MFNDKPQIPSVEVETLKDALDVKSDLVVLDVRTPQEFSKGKIKGSINLPVDVVAENVEKIVPDKKTIVYVYCLSGSRSMYAVNTMIQLGYTNIFDVKSGLLAWRANQYPLDD